MRFIFLSSALLLAACSAQGPAEAPSTVSSQAGGLSYEPETKTFRSIRTGREWPPQPNSNGGR